jgi:hypothetical protein
MLAGRYPAAEAGIRGEGGEVGTAVPLSPLTRITESSPMPPDWLLRWECRTREGAMSDNFS